MQPFLTEWTGLDPTTVATIGMAVLFAAFVRGMTGFGLAIVLSPLLVLVLTPERAVLLNVLLGTLIGPIGLLETSKLADTRQTLPFSVAAVATAPIGLWLLSYTPGRRSAHRHRNDRVVVVLSHHRKAAAAAAAFARAF